MSTQNLRSIIVDFTNDLTKVFPEYSFLWEKWLYADDAEYEKLHQHFMSVFPERFFDIMNSNADIFSPDSELNVMFLPDVDFRLLFNCEGVSEGTKKSMWKYLQLLLFTVLGSVKDTTDFGETMNMFENMDENELQNKMKETMEGMEEFFRGFEGATNEGLEGLEGTTNEDSNEDTTDETEQRKPYGFKMPKPEVIQEHMKTLMEGKLGKLAKELTEEFTGDLKDIFDESEDTRGKSMKDIMAHLMKDPKKITNVMKKITERLKTKLESGDISQDELMKEVATLVEKFKEMGGGEDFMKSFTNGPFAKMFKNMAGGASANQIIQQGKQSAMKERLRKKMEERKAREVANALAQASLNPIQEQTKTPQQIVVTIGEEKQEKSGLKPLTEDELVKLFGKKKKAKK